MKTKKREKEGEGENICRGSGKRQNRATYSRRRVRTRYLTQCTCSLRRRGRVHREKSLHCFLLFLRVFVTRCSSPRGFPRFKPERESQALLRLIFLLAPTLSARRNYVPILGSLFLAVRLLCQRTGLSSFKFILLSSSSSSSSSFSPFSPFGAVNAVMNPKLCRRGGAYLQ